MSGAPLLQKQERHCIFVLVSIDGEQIADTLIHQNSREEAAIVCGCRHGVAWGALQAVTPAPNSAATQMAEIAAVSSPLTRNGVAQLLPVALHIARPVPRKATQAREGGA